MTPTLTAEQITAIEKAIQVIVAVSQSVLGFVQYLLSHFGTFLRILAESVMRYRRQELSVPKGIETRVVAYLTQWERRSVVTKWMSKLRCSLRGHNDGPIQLAI